MATLDPAARAVLLQDFATALRIHANDRPAAAGTVAQLRAKAQCSWSDLLHVPGKDAGYVVMLACYGTARKAGVTLADLGAAVLHLAAWCPPYTLAAVVVAIHLPSHDPAQTFDHLCGVVMGLHTARERGGAGEHPIAWTPRSSPAAPGLPWM